MDLSAIIILTNQCNLKCAHCVYGCDLELQPYYITIKELQDTLKLMKQKLPSLTRLILSGGDAFMHPLLLQICQEVRKIFPNIDLCAYTNGLLLDQISDNDLLYLVEELKLNIISSVYPSINNLNKYKNQSSRFKALKIPLYYQYSHFYFDKVSFNNKKQNIPIQYINNHYYTRCKTLTIYNNLITIYKNKILVCCGEVGYINSNSGDSSDLLNLNTLKTESQIIDFCKYPHKICERCVADHMENQGKILWSKRTSLTQKYQNDNLKSIFIKNYSDYKDLYLNNKEHLFCFNDTFFSDKIDPLEHEYLNVKYKHGIADIFIPYDNNLNDKQIQLLRNKIFTIPNIEKYNLYFVGINTSKQTNQNVINTFYFPHSFKIHTTFLLGHNLTLGYKEFIEYSYLENKILLDITNFLDKGEL